MGILPRLFVLALLGGAAAFGAVRARDRYLPAGETLPGLRVGGEVVAKGALHAVVASEADAIRNRKVHLVSDKGDDFGEHTLGELGVKIDDDAILARAEHIGHDGDFITRARESQRAARGEIDVPIEAFTQLDTAPFVQIVAQYKESLDAAPASARLDLAHRTVIPEKPGRYLDAFGAVAALQHAMNDASVDRVIVPFAEVAPRVTSDFVSKLDVHAVLGTFDTYFSRSGDQARRGKNIDLGASKLDGVVLMPGEIVSFNAIVGDRSEENGFQRSWEIYKGEMVEGVGGGTCQVASTLHAAAFFGGLEVLERLPHSRPSAYIPMGLDSTVVYPIVDLKLRNPNAFPVVIHATTDGNKLTIQLLGAGKPAKVTFAREVLDTKAYPRKVEEDPRLTGNHVTVKQHGIRGFRVKRTRTVTFEDGRKKIETNIDVYPPTTEIYAVPPGFDESTLPALPTDDDDGNSASQTNAPPQTSASTDANATPNANPNTNVVYIDAPGAHAPTNAQKTPEKSITLTR
jgi:vancomycin resistance protein YoaR